MTVCEKIMTMTEDEKLAVFRACMADLVEETAKWLKENDYFTE